MGTVVDKYYLRNQDKIAAAYGEDILKRIIESLNAYFRVNMVARMYDSEGDKYKVLIIPDIEHTVNDIAFYVVCDDYPYRLAFKEFIG